jgi:hypothetical protein
VRSPFRALCGLGLALVLAWAPGAAAPGRGGQGGPAPPLLCPGPPGPEAGGPAGWTSYQDCLATIQAWGAALPDWIVHSWPLSYPARKPVYDAAGHPVLDPQGGQATVPVTLTGRMFFPPAWRVALGGSLPLVVYSHATELRKDAVPSAFGGNEWMLGAAAAAWFGLAVAMPDLPGMGGDGASFHPFCHARSLAYAVVDSIPASRAAFAADPFPAAHGYSWDGRLFLMGYSEGGYTTLATVRELEARGDPTLAGSACMAGPFDLSGAMRATFIDPAVRYPRSYYLPYFVLGYHAVYGPRLDPLEVFAPVLLAPGADGDILAWCDGSQGGEAVDGAVGRRLDQPPEAVNLRRMFNPPWLARELDDPAYAASPVHALLAENDLCGGWAPTRPILFRHSPDDVNIPYANTLTTLDQLGQAIRAAGGDPDAILLSLPIGAPGDHISHTEGALIAIPSAFAWFYYGMPRLDTFRKLRW